MTVFSRFDITDSLWLHSWRTGETSSPISSCLLLKLKTSFTLLQQVKCLILYPWSWLAVVTVYNCSPRDLGAKSRTVRSHRPDTSCLPLSALSSTATGEFPCLSWGAIWLPGEILPGQNLAELSHKISMDGRSSWGCCNQYWPNPIIPAVRPLPFLLGLRWQATGVGWLNKMASCLTEIIWVLTSKFYWQGSAISATI